MPEDTIEMTGYGEYLIDKNSGLFLQFSTTKHIL